MALRLGDIYASRNAYAPSGIVDPRRGDLQRWQPSNPPPRAVSLRVALEKRNCDRLNQEVHQTNASTREDQERSDAEARREAFETFPNGFLPSDQTLPTQTIRNLSPPIWQLSGGEVKRLNLSYIQEQCHTILYRLYAQDGRYNNKYNRRQAHLRPLKQAQYMLLDHEDLLARLLPFSPKSYAYWSCAQDLLQTRAAALELDFTGFGTPVYDAPPLMRISTSITNPQRSWGAVRTVEALANFLLGSVERKYEELRYKNQTVQPEQVLGGNTSATDPSTFLNPSPVQSPRREQADLSRGGLEGEDEDAEDSLDGEAMLH